MFDPTTVNWGTVLKFFKKQCEWEATNFPGSWRHEKYIGHVQEIEKILGVVPLEFWFEHELRAMEKYWAIGGNK